MIFEEGEYYIMKNECSTTAKVCVARHTKDDSIILVPLYTKNAKINIHTGDIELDRLSKQQKRTSILIQKVP
jgi:hypothetical protein